MGGLIALLLLLLAVPAHSAVDAWGGDTSIASTASGRFRLEQITGH